MYVDDTSCVPSCCAEVCVLAAGAAPAALRPFGTTAPGVRRGAAAAEAGQRSREAPPAAAMPVWLREHSWRQTLTAVYLSLPLRGARATPANIFCSEQYLKVGGRAPLASRASCRAGPRPRGLLHNPAQKHARRTPWQLLKFIILYLL